MTDTVIIGIIQDEITGKIKWYEPRGVAPACKLRPKKPGIYQKH